MDRQLTSAIERGESAATDLGYSIAGSSTESPGLLEFAGAVPSGAAPLTFDVDALRAELDRAKLEIELGHLGEAVPALRQVLAALSRRDRADREVAVLRGSALTSLGAARWEWGDNQSAQRLFAEAAELLGSHLPLDPHRDGDYGIALRHLGRTEEAIAALQRAVEGGDRSCATRLTLGLALTDADRLDEAEDTLRTAGADFRHDRRIHVALAMLLETRGSPEAAQAYRSAVYLAAEAGRVHDALTLARKAVELADDDWMSHASTGEVLRQLGDHADALTSLRRAQELAPAEEPRLLGSLGSTLSALGRSDEALTALDRALELMPEYTFGLSLRGAILRSQGRNEEAVEVLERLLSLEPNDVRAYGDLTFALVELGKEEAARAALARGLAIDPEASPLHALRGYLLRREGEFDEAIHVLEEIVEREPENVFARIELGESLRLAQRFAEALPHLDRALELAGDTAWVQGTRGQVLLGLDRTEEALSALRHACDLDPNLAWVWGELGNALLATSENEEALSAFDRALGLGADRIGTLKLEARALRNLRRWPEALEILEQVLEERPDDAEALAAGGQAYRVLERYPEALASFRAALELDPSSTWFLGEFAEALRRMGQHDEALVTIDRALAKQGENAWDVGTRGQILNALGDTEAALEALTRAVELDPTLAWAHTDIGYILAEQRQYETALARFDAALASGPEPYALAGRGQVLRLLGRTAEAVESLQQAVRLNSEVAWFHAELGEALRVLDRLEEALSELNTSLELEPGDTWAMASFASALYGAERYDEALEQLDQVVAQDPNYAFAVGTRGEIWCKLAEWEAAIADLSRSIQLDGQNPWFHGILGWAYENVERPDDARESYRTALGLDPDSIFWHRGHAEALYTLRKPEALGEFEHIVETWGSKADTEPEELSIVGWCNYRLGRFDKAVRCYTDDIASSKEPEPTQFDLALALAASGRETLAIPEYERGIEMARRKPPRRQLGLFRVARRDARIALERLDEDLAQRAPTEGEPRVDVEAARQALASGERMLEDALTEASAGTPALTST